MDFTLSRYQKLLTLLKVKGYSFQTFHDFLLKPEKKAIIMRHDVDLRPGYALKMARLENNMGVSGTYYFRITGNVFKEKIIKEIVDLGHEIGYHYEDLAVARGDMPRAIGLFKRNLGSFREIYPVKTISMHGSPWSKWKNNALWKEYRYKDFGIVGEANLDLRSQSVIYLTDTGRTWNWHKRTMLNKNKKSKKPSFKSTKEIISRINELPNKIMINTHPQRWTDSPLPWMKELVLQRVKNVVKKLIVKS